MKLEKIERENYYHIYNRGINGATIFKNEENKRYFLQLFGKYLSDKVTVLAFCLMDNHYHFLVEIIEDENKVTQGFSNLFNAYAKAFNKQENRTGSLFEKHFKRKRIQDENYLLNLIVYIHNNPKYDKEDYLYSSYHYYLNDSQPKSILLHKEVVFNLFDTIENMKLVINQRAGLTNEDLNIDLQGGFAEKAKQHLAGPEKAKQHLAGPEKAKQHLAGPEKAKQHLAGPKKPLGLNTQNTMKEQFVAYIKNLQNQITSGLEEVDGHAKFKEDKWTREEGGGGLTRVIENGAVFEKGGVNISEVHGKLPESMQQYFGVKDANFFACGLSLVIHPKSPMVPTVHANWRYFEMYDQAGKLVDSWFGGGQDLTPYYLFEEDAIHFHQVCKNACDKHSHKFEIDLHQTYKKRCDAYFWNAHRNEARGVGGLFFDYLKASEGVKMQDWYNFVTEVGNSFLDCYLPIVEKRKSLSYSEAQKNWQEIRRGRYVEFNLVHDKGTLFGLKTNGRIESILMSLPPQVQWRYDFQPAKESEEEKLVEVLKNPKDWV